MSASRSTRSFTGRPVFAASTAAAHAKSAGWLSLPPKPPPMRRHCTITSCEARFERVRDEVLHLARVLRRGEHQHRAVFLRQGDGDLSFEVEMVLAADR